MLKTLNTKLVLLFTLLFTLVVLGLHQWFSYNTSQYNAEVRQTLHRDLASHIVMDDNHLKKGVINSKQLKPAFHTQMLLGPEWEFYALDPKGNILAYSAPEGVVKLTSINLQPVKNYLNGGHFPIYGQDPRTPGTNKVFSVTEIFTPSGQLSGYLYVIIGGQKRDNTEQLLAAGSLFNQSVGMVIGMLVFAIGVSLIVIKTIIQPLQVLANKSQQYVNDDFHNASFEPRSDFISKEIRDLELSFQRAAHHISYQLGQIKTTDQLRRELLAHVSHDFRTPLAALNGYLETWLICPEKSRSNSLIESALRNGQQLNTLVDQLFELARLETGDVQFSPETINIAELAQDVTQGLRWQAAQKQIELAVTLKTAQQPLAQADVGKLERVLVNLIENAIRHTQESGRVAVEVEQQAQSVKVAVIDNGKGIPEHELPAIFEASYQASNTSGTHGNAGLGLTIVKRLLALHNSDIQVYSVQGKGTMFSFQLPVVG